MNVLQAFGWRADDRWLYANALPFGLMLAAGAVWFCYAGKRRGQESPRQMASRDLELMLSCLLLNAGALLVWSLWRGEAGLLRLWALNALICAMPNLLWPLGRRPGGWAAAYSALAGAVLLLRV